MLCQYPECPAEASVGRFCPVHAKAKHLDYISANPATKCEVCRTRLTKQDWVTLDSSPSLAYHAAPCRAKPKNKQKVAASLWEDV